MLLTLKTINLKLREIDRMQKRQIKSKAFRTQTSRDIIVHKNDRKKFEKTKKVFINRRDNKNVTYRDCKETNKFYYHFSKKY